MEVEVLDIKGEKTGEVNLPEEVFDVEERPDLVYEVYVATRANMRKGSASTKTRSEVRGGGRKPWRQKGTGRARHGTIRSPIWRGGGITFGPKPRSYTKKIPKKMKRFALYSVISHRFRNDSLMVVDDIKLDEYKTRFVVNMLDDLQLNEGDTLIITDEYNPYLFKSVSNIPNANICDYKRVSTFDVVTHDNLLFTKKAIENFVEVR